MMMMLDITNANVKFEEAKNALAAKGKELKVDVKMQREEIFESMHSL